MNRPLLEPGYGNDSGDCERVMGKKVNPLFELSMNLSLIMRI